MAVYLCSRCQKKITEADIAAKRALSDSTGLLFCLDCVAAIKAEQGAIAGGKGAASPAALVIERPSAPRGAGSTPAADAPFGAAAPAAKETSRGRSGADAARPRNPGRSTAARTRRSRAERAERPQGGGRTVLALAAVALVAACAGAYFLMGRSDEGDGAGPQANASGGSSARRPAEDERPAGAPEPEATSRPEIDEPVAQPARVAAARAAEEPASFTPPEPVVGRETTAAGSNIVAYVGGRGSARFEKIAALSDGTFVVSGSAKDLDWLPAGTETSVLRAEGIENAPEEKRIAFLLQVSSDLSRFLRLVHLPAGAAQDIRYVKTTNAPGEATGDMYVSGTVDNPGNKATGYFIARLDGNFVDRAPARALWVKNVAASGNVKQTHGWDVGSDGKVLYASGQPYSYDWFALYRLKADGTDDVVPHWRVHWGELDGKDTEHKGTLSGAPGLVARQSAIVLKMWGRPCLRSMTQADYDAWLPDGNGGWKKGRWPCDYWFAGPFGSEAKGRGYTGYRPGSTPCGRCVAVAVDRRNNDMYFGFNFKSRLPDGGPDFEPGVVAMTKDGELKWWSRLYHEFLDKNGNRRLDPGEPTTSTPDQYVDHLAIDYSTNALVVQARCHGNNVINFWSGNKVAARPGADTFHNGFTGSGGNFHIGWLGKLALADGALRACCYFATYAAGRQSFGKPYADPNLDGWPSHNSGWPRLNTTACKDLAVDSKGRVYVVGLGRWPITTRNAFQKMYKPGEGKSKWSDFVRVYTPNFETLVYSSILTGTWKPETEGEGASSVDLGGVLPVAGGAVVVGGGGFAVSKAGEVKGTNPMPTANVPGWGSAVPRREEAGVVANLRF